MYEAELCKLVISTNIPRNWWTQFRLVGGHAIQSLLDRKRIMLLLGKEEKSKASKSNVKDRRSKGNGNSKCGGVSRPRKSGIKNPCKLPGHQNHNWKDCSNNPKSDKFKGTARKPSDYYNYGKLKKKTKESQQTESKKKKKKKDEEEDSESESESESEEGEYMSDDDSVSSYESFNHIDEESNEVKKQDYELLNYINDCRRRGFQEK